MRGLGRWFDNATQCCAFKRMRFVVLGGQNYLYQGNWRARSCNHRNNTSFSLRYNMRRLIDGKFRRLGAKTGGFMSI